MAQHDYVIANGTGAAVRSDLNNALAAIVSNNSGATEPTTTYAYMWWPDTTTGTLKLRNGANNAWITLRQLDGDFTTVSVDNGSNSAPSIYFNASGTDTGIYSSGTDAIDITTAGTRRLGIASGGDVTVYGGNVTLNGQGDLRFADSDSSNWVALQAPATVASNVTWTLPSADGSASQVLSTNGSGALSWTTISSGKILQVMRSHVAGKASTTSTSLTKLATSASITPSSSSSKIKITISTALGNADTGNANFSIVRTVGGVDTTVFSNVANKQGASGAYQYDAFAWADLDSPSTTSAVTYSISGIRLDGNATPFVGGRNTDSSYAMGVMFILEEVAA